MEDENLMPPRMAHCSEFGKVFHYSNVMLEAIRNSDIELMDKALEQITQAAKIVRESGVPKWDLEAVKRLFGEPSPRPVAERSEELKK
jgi:hypothetical protein